MTAPQTCWQMWEGKGRATLGEQPSVNIHLGLGKWVPEILMECLPEVETILEVTWSLYLVIHTTAKQKPRLWKLMGHVWCRWKQSDNLAFTPWYHSESRIGIWKLCTFSREKEVCSSCTMYIYCTVQHYNLNIIWNHLKVKQFFYFK